MTLPLSLDLDGLAGALEAAATVAILIVLLGLLETKRQSESGERCERGGCDGEV